MPRSTCGTAQSDQGLCYLLTESMSTTECINGEQMPGPDFAHASDESESVYFARARRHLLAWREPYGISTNRQGFNLASRL